MTREMFVFSVQISIPALAFYGIYYYANISIVKVILFVLTLGSYGPF